MSEKETEILEVDQYAGQEEQVFSHQSLVMSAFKKCIEAGCVEMKEGWFEEKEDKNGRIIKKYNPDTRMVFIESIKTLMNIMSCDIDEETENKLIEQKNKLNKIKKFWLEQELAWWNKLNENQKRQAYLENKNVMPGFFNRKLDFFNFYIDDSVEIYREIFSILNNRTKELDFYATIGFIGK